MMNRVLWSMWVMSALVWGGGCQQTHERAVLSPEIGLSAEHATLRIPSRVEVVAVDGQRVQTRTLLPMREAFVLKLNPGTHRVTARPRAVYSLEDEEHGITYATATTLEFEVEADSIYRLVYRPETDDGVERTPGDSLWVEKLADD